MENKKNIWKIIRFFIALGLFNFLAYPVMILLIYGFKLDISQNNINNLLIADTIYSIILVIIVIFLYKDKLINDFKKIKEKKSNELLKKVIMSGLVVFAVKIGAAVIVSILSFILNLEETSVENQKLVEELLKSAPLVMIISSVIFAPITEELIFRAGVFDVVKNKKVYIAVSGLIFGLMHVTDSVILTLEILLLGVVISRLVNNNKYEKNTKLALSFAASSLILMIFSGIYFLEFGNLINKLISLDMIEVVGSIVYIAVGVYLAKLYESSENILYTISVHALNNLVSVLLIL